MSNVCDAWIGFAGSVVGGVFVLVGVLLSNYFSGNRQKKNVAPKIVIKQFGIGKGHSKLNGIYLFEFVDTRTKHESQNAIIDIKNIGLGDAHNFQLTDFTFFGKTANEGTVELIDLEQPISIPLNNSLILAITYTYLLDDGFIKKKMDILKESNEYTLEFKNQFVCKMKYDDALGNKYTKKITGSVIFRRKDPSLQYTTCDGMFIENIKNSDN